MLNPHVSTVCISFSTLIFYFLEEDMVNMKRNMLWAVMSAAVVATPSAFATNGYFAHGYSMKEQGVVGAGVALSQDSLAAATNPAGMVMVGNRMDIGASWFKPIRKYDATGTAGVPNGFACGALCPFEIGPQSITSDNENFLIPQFGYNTMLDANSSFGVSVYGNGGMNTEYKGGSAQHNNGLGVAVTTAGTYGAGTSGVDLAQLFIAPTYAMKVGSNNAVGASVILAYQRFKALGLANFGGYSTDSSNLTDNGYDNSTGFGFKVGWQGQITPAVALGASYQSKVNMKKFKKYAGLFAEGGDFDVPSTATVGLAFKTTPTSKVVLDVQRINYTDVAAVSNPISYLVASTNSCAAGTAPDKCLGGSNGAGFG
ncbi:MAG: outer membrane protein transport protein, partial [Gammaproteobacteria bacterium]|nr:outer membrane protein transport protein [Gammaproteobacteria bacterium]